MSTKKIRMAILAMSMLQMSTMAIAPSLAEISKAFPQASVTLIQLLVTLPGLMMVPSAILSGLVAARVSKKSIAVGAVAIVCVGGLLPLLFHQSLVQLLFFSGLIGIGLGPILPIGSSLIAEYFTGESQSRLLGVQAATVNGGGVLISIASGILAAGLWYRSYYAFLIAVPILLIIILLLPVDKPQSAGTGHARPKIYRLTFILSCLTFVFVTVFNTFPTNIALYVTENKLGDSAFAGTATAVLLGGGLISGLLFSRMNGLLKQYTLPLGYLIAGSGLLFLIHAKTPVSILLSCFFGGLGMGFVLPKSLNILTANIPGPSRSINIALHIGITNFGLFSSPIIINALAAALEENGAILRCTIGGVLGLVMSVCVLIVFLWRKPEAMR